MVARRPHSQGSPRRRRAAARRRRRKRFAAAYMSRPYSVLLPNQQAMAAPFGLGAQLPPVAGAGAPPPAAVQVPPQALLDRAAQLAAAGHPNPVATAKGEWHVAAAAVGPPPAAGAAMN